MKILSRSVALALLLAGSAEAVPRRDAPGSGNRLAALMVEGKTLSGNYLFEVVKRSKPHADTLTRLLRGQRGLPAWVRNMVSRGNYVTAASMQVVVGGVAMELFSACQPHNCDGSELKALFSADGKVGFLRIRDQRLGEVFLGEPGAAEKEPLAANGL